MKKEDMVRIIITSKYNEKYTKYSKMGLMKKSKEELEKLYQEFLDLEYKAILKNRI